MSGRQKSRFSLVLLVLLIVIAIVGAAGWFLYSRFSDPFRQATPLDVSAYASSANHLRGNTYQLEGEVMNSLAWSPSAGRLFSVGIDGGKKAVAVLLPNEFNRVNVQKGQKFRFLLVVDDKGLLRTRRLAKL